MKCFLHGQVIVILPPKKGWVRFDSGNFSKPPNRKTHPEKDDGENRLTNPGLEVNKWGVMKVADGMTELDVEVPRLLGTFQGVGCFMVGRFWIPKDDLDPQTSKKDQKGAMDSNGGSLHLGFRFFDDSSRIYFLEIYPP